MNEPQPSPLASSWPPKWLPRMPWIAAGLAVVAAAVYAGLWLMLAAGLRNLAGEWLDKQRAAGWAIAAEGPATGGFPRWPEVSLTNVSVTAPADQGGWSWRTNRVTAVPSDFGLTTLAVIAPGAHFFDTPVSPNGVWTLETITAVMDVTLSRSGRMQGAQVRLGDAEIRDSFERPWLGAQRLVLGLALAPEPVQMDDIFAAFSGAADNLQFGVRLGPFDRTVRAVRLDADLIGPIEPTRLSEALDAWRTGGGTLEVRRFMLDWPPLAITGDGTVSLDEQLQPIGAFSTRITGFTETLQAMAEAGAITRQQSAGAGVMLNLMARTPPGEDRPELEVPLTVQEQTLSIGPLPLLAVPEVVWD